MLLAALIPAAADVYDFDGSMTEACLRAYLARAAGWNGICCLGQEFPEKYHDDSLRAVANVKPMYISRAVLAWETPKDPEAHFKRAADSAAELHAIDSRILLEAAIFEAVYSLEDGPDVDRIPIPARVFEAFGLPAEDRCFRYEDMLFPDGRYRDYWGKGISVPDITRTETRMWEYYRACRYIDAGYEAINFGAVELTGVDDTGLEARAQVLSLVRAYGRQHARRHCVLCTGHLKAGSALRDGRLLWDLAEFPLRLVTGTEPITASIQPGHRDATYGTLPGGQHPMGWQTAALPCLYEFDNYLSGIDARNIYAVWGTDETSWFASCKPGYRNYFLKYAADRISRITVNGFLMMPCGRPCRVPLVKPQQYVYLCNEPSEACPIGGGQEDTIKALFERRYDLAPAPALREPDKRERGEQLGFDPMDGGIGERLFRKAESYTAPNYTNGYIKDVFDVYGVSPAPEKPADFVPGPKQAGISPAGLALDGPTVEVRSFPEISGGSLTVYAAFMLSPEVWEDSFMLLEKYSFMKSGWYVKYYKPEDSLYAEIFDGSGERRTVDFPVPRDGGLHRICFVCDGKRLSAYLDGALADKTPAGSIVPDATNLILSGGLAGTLSDIRIYNYALSQRDAERLSSGLMEEEPEEEPDLVIFGEIRRRGRGFGISIGF